MEGRRGRGVPCYKWLSGVKKYCNVKSLELRDAKVKFVVGEQCRDFTFDVRGDMSVLHQTKHFSGEEH